MCKLAHAFMWEYSQKGLNSAQLLGQLGVCLTCSRSIASESCPTHAASPSACEEIGPCLRLPQYLGGLQSHSDAALHILYGQSLMKCRVVSE